MNKIFYLLLILCPVIHAQKYDTLNKGDKVWIFDGNDSGYGRIATIVSDEFGKDYFGNNSHCLIKFAESGNGCRGIMLSSIIKIHDKHEYKHYRQLELNRLKEIEKSNLNKNKYILRDTHHEDYYSTKHFWVRDINKASTFEYKQAIKLLKELQFDKNDEYSDPAPIVIEKIN